MNLSSQKINSAGRFGLIWLLANAAGWGLGFGLQLNISRVDGPSGLTNLFATLVAAGIVGLAQWLVLRWLLAGLRPGSQGIAWVILSMFGYIIGFLTASLLVGVFGENLSPGAAAAVAFLTWGLTGLTTGALQWMEIQFFARGAAWWVGANAVGYGLGGLLLGVLRVRQYSVLLTYAMAGLLVGAVTLVAISRLRRRSRGTISSEN